MAKPSSERRNLGGGKYQTIDTTSKGVKTIRTYQQPKHVFGFTKQVGTKVIRPR